jgi:hypothetical protein
MTEARIGVYTFEDQLVASIRFEDDLDAVAGRFQALYDRLGDQVAGQALCRYHGRTAEGQLDLEIGYPVSSSVEEQGITCQTWEGGEFLGIEHRAGSRAGFDTVLDALRALYDYADSRDIGLSTGPTRQVWQKGNPAADVPGRQVSALCAPLLMPRWFRRLADHLERHLGAEARDTVMAGHESLSPLSDPRTKSYWAKTAMERLDELTEDEEVRQAIMSGCAHVYPQARIDALRRVYEEAGDIDAVIEVMRRDTSWLEGLSYYAAPMREGNTVYVTKVPCRVQAYREATDPREKRAHYCHCPMVRAAIREGRQISDTYCYCGTGWFVQLWSGIVGQSVEVELLESILRGDDRCRVAIHLPVDVVS